MADLFEQLMQKNWFILLVVLIIPLSIGISGAYLYSRRRKRSRREQNDLVLIPSQVTKAGYALGIAALSSCGVLWLLRGRYFEGAGAVIGAMEMARWYPATIRFSESGLSWSTPFKRDQMQWEDVSCARKRVTFVRKVDDSFEVFGSAGQRLIIETSAHPDARRMISSISNELRRRGLAPSGMPHESMVEWFHKALSFISVGLFVYGRFGVRH